MVSWSFLLSTVFIACVLLFALFFPFIFVHFIAAMIRYARVQRLLLIPGWPMVGGTTQLTLVVQNPRGFPEAIVVVLHHVRMNLVWTRKGSGTFFYLPYFVINIPLIELQRFTKSEAIKESRSVKYGLAEGVGREFVKWLICSAFCWFVKLQVQSVDVLTVCLDDAGLALSHASQGGRQQYLRDLLSLDQERKFLGFSNEMWWEILGVHQDYALACRMKCKQVSFHGQMASLRSYKTEMACAELCGYIRTPPSVDDLRVYDGETDAETRYFPKHSHGGRCEDYQEEVPLFMVSDPMRVQFKQWRRFSWWGNATYTSGASTQVNIILDSVEKTPQASPPVLVYCSLRQLTEMLRYFGGRIHRKQCGLVHVKGSQRPGAPGVEERLGVNPPNLGAMSLEMSRVICILFDETCATQMLIDTRQSCVKCYWSKILSFSLSIHAKSTSLFMGRADSALTPTFDVLTHMLNGVGYGDSCKEPVREGAGVLEPLGILKCWTLSYDREGFHISSSVHRQHVVGEIPEAYFRLFSVGLVLWMRIFVHLFTLFQRFKLGLPTRAENGLCRRQTTTTPCLRIPCVRCHKIFGTALCHAGPRLCCCVECTQRQKDLSFTFASSHHHFEKSTDEERSVGRPISQSQWKEIFERIQCLSQFCKETFLGCSKATLFSLGRFWIVLDPQDIVEAVPESPFSKFKDSNEAFVIQLHEFLFRVCSVSPVLSCHVERCLLLKTHVSSKLSPSEYFHQTVACIKEDPTRSLEQHPHYAVIALLKKLVFLPHSFPVDVPQPGFRRLHVVSFHHACIYSWDACLCVIRLLKTSSRHDNLFFQNKIQLTKIYPHQPKSSWATDFLFHCRFLHIYISQTTCMSFKSPLLYQDNDFHVVWLNFKKILAQTWRDKIHPPCFVANRVEIWLGCHTLSLPILLEHLEHFVDISNSNTLPRYSPISHTRIAVSSLHFFFSSLQPLPFLKQNFLDRFLLPLANSVKQASRQETRDDSCLLSPNSPDFFQTPVVKLYTVQLQEASLTFYHSQRDPSPPQHLFREMLNTKAYSSHYRLPDDAEAASDQEKCEQCTSLNSWVLKKNFMGVWDGLVHPLLYLNIDCCRGLFRFSYASSRVKRESGSPFCLKDYVSGHSLQHMCCRGLALSVFETPHGKNPPPTVLSFLSTSLCILHHSLVSPSGVCSFNLTRKRSMVEHQGVMSLHFNKYFTHLLTYIIETLVGEWQRWWIPQTEHNSIEVAEKTMCQWAVFFFARRSMVVWKSLHKTQCFPIGQGGRCGWTTQPLLACVVPLLTVSGRYDTNASGEEKKDLTVQLQHGLFVYAPVSLTDTWVMPDNCLVNVYYVKIVARYRQDTSSPITLCQWSVNVALKGPSLSQGFCCGKNKEDDPGMPRGEQVTMLHELHGKRLGEWSLIQSVVFHPNIVIPSRDCSLFPCLINLHPSLLVELYRRGLGRDDAKNAAQEVCIEMKNSGDGQKKEVKATKKQIKVEILVEHLKCRIGVLRWNAQSMTVVQRREVDSWSSLGCFALSPESPKAVESMEIEGRCQFGSLAVDYDDTLLLVHPFQKQLHGISLFFFPPAMPSQVIPLMQLDGVEIVFKNTASLNLQLHGCSFSWNVLTMVSLLAAAQRWSLLRQELRYLREKESIEEPYTVKNKIHYLNPSKKEEFFMSWMRHVLQLNITMTAINVQMNVHHVDLSGVSSTRHWVTRRHSTRHVSHRSKKSRLREQFKLLSHSKNEDEELSHFTLSSFSSLASFSSTASDDESKEDHATSSQQDSPTPKRSPTRAPHLYYPTFLKPYPPKSLRRLPPVHPSSHVDWLDSPTTALESLHLDALDLRTKKDTLRRTRTNLFCDDTFLCDDDFVHLSLCDVADKVSFLFSSGVLRHPHFMTCEALKYFVQSHCVWILSTELLTAQPEHASSSPPLSAKKCFSDVVHSSTICKRVRQSLSTMSWSVSRGSYLETDVWTKCLQNKTWLMHTSRVKAYQWIMSSSLVETEMNISLTSPPSKFQDVLVYKCLLKTQAVLGHIGLLGMQGLIWRSPESFSPLTPSPASPCASLCATRVLAEILRSKPVTFQAAGHLALAHQVFFPHHIQIDCPVLVMSCTSESVQQLIWLIQSVVVGGTAFPNMPQGKKAKYADPTVLFQTTHPEVLDTTLQRSQKIKNSPHFKRCHALFMARKVQKHIETYLLRYRNLYVMPCFHDSVSSSLPSEEYLQETEIRVQCRIGQISFSFLRYDQVFCRCSFSECSLKVCRFLSKHQCLRFSLDITDVLVNYVRPHGKQSHKTQDACDDILAPLPHRVFPLVLSIESLCFTIPIVDPQIAVVVRVYDEFTIKVHPLQLNLTHQMIEQFYGFLFPTSRSVREAIDVVNPRFPLPQVADDPPKHFPTIRRDKSFSKTHVYTYHNRFFVFPLTAVMTFEGVHVSLKNVPIHFKAFICSHKLLTVREMIKRYLWFLGRQTTTGLISQKIRRWVDRWQWKFQSHKIQGPSDKAHASLK